MHGRTATMWEVSGISRTHKPHASTHRNVDVGKLRLPLPPLPHNCAALPLTRPLFRFNIIDSERKARSPSYMIWRDLWTRAGGGGMGGGGLRYLADSEKLGSISLRPFVPLRIQMNLSAQGGSLFFLSFFGGGVGGGGANVFSVPFRKPPKSVCCWGLQMNGRWCV